MTINDITLTLNSFESTLGTPYTVPDTNKVTLANASNKSDVYPITYASCVKVTESKTLDDILKDERNSYTNILIVELVKKINAVIDQAERNDTTLENNIKTLETKVNTKVGLCGDGLDIQASNDDKQISLKLGGGLTCNASKLLTVRVAPPLYINSDGVICLNYDTSDFVVENGKLCKK